MRPAGGTPRATFDQQQACTGDVLERFLQMSLNRLRKIAFFESLDAPGLSIFQQKIELRLGSTGK